LLVLDKKGLMEEYKANYHVIELGWVDDDKELAHIYNLADIVLMPSLAESFGLTAIEAMACGRTVLGFDGTSLADTIFPPLGGIVVKQGNVEQLIKTIVGLLNNKSKRQVIGKSARLLAKKHYSIKRYIDNHISLYQEIIADKKLK
jgi:glycosyltransferase involved in cell wall biosynthesis